jgi:hypothetical protein
LMCQPSADLRRASDPLLRAGRPAPIPSARDAVNRLPDHPLKATLCRYVADNSAQSPAPAPAPVQAPPDGPITPALPFD